MAKLWSRLTVGHIPLEDVILVRIQAPQLCQRSSPPATLCVAMRAGNGRTADSGSAYRGPPACKSYCFSNCWQESLSRSPCFAKATDDYILRLYPQKLKIRQVYYGYTKDLKRRIKEHNEGKSKYTKGHLPVKLVFYSAFEKMDRAKEFELYLKSGSGKAFVYKRLAY